MGDTILSIEALEILSGTGRPTVGVVLVTTGGLFVEASVPSGTSKGKYEAWELHDGGARYRGLGVQVAVENVNRLIAPRLCGLEVGDHRRIDNLLIQLDGTENKRRLGANAILAVSLAVAKAAAATSGHPLYVHLGGEKATLLPVPVATVLAGGKHSPSLLPFEDYMFVMNGFDRFSEAVEGLVEARYCLARLVAERFGNVPEEGGALAPPLRTTEEAFDVMLEAADRAGVGDRVSLGLDVAGSDLFIPESRRYRAAGWELTADALTEYLLRLTGQYPLTFIEDPFEQDDFDRFARLTATLAGKQVVGDDLFATNLSRIKMGIEKKACNTLLLKINQIGTVSEALDAGQLAVTSGYDVVVSLRSSDTTDSFIADLAVALGARQIKLGSPVRGERNAKYNRLLWIEHELGREARFAGRRRSG
ncbi:MAG: enolase C-terminal domain-like protein [Bacillota bacterium]|nr:enolase C-terminal domain-like protein [Bacillota bacterium]